MIKPIIFKVLLIMYCVIVMRALGIPTRSVTNFDYCLQVCYQSCYVTLTTASTYSHTISLAIFYCYYRHNMALGSQGISWGHTWTTDPIFEQKRYCSQRFLCFAISDGKKTASGLTVPWNNTSRAWRRNPGPDYSFYLNLTNYGNYTHLEMRRSNLWMVSSTLS